MRSTLFLIPFEVGGVPLFGFGVLLALWAIGSIAMFAWLVRKQGWVQETLEYIPVLAVLGAAIYFLPKLFADLGGIPVRGYGVMVLIGAVGGIALASRRAKRMGLNPETIVSICFWMVVVGILAARAFYVVQYWDDGFAEPTFMATLKNVVDYTKGGLVIYGAIFGGAIAFFVYTRYYKLPALAMADLIAPGLAFGIAFGRLGCFLHGCCYGGLCDAAWAVTFPPGSPPAIHQAERGILHGFQLSGKPKDAPVVLEVEPGSLADKAGLKKGDVLKKVGEHSVTMSGEVAYALVKASQTGQPLILQTEHATLLLPPVSTTRRTRPIHPTQLYSAALAGALAWVLWSFYPFRKHDGEVLALLMTLYPIGRFLLEIVRSDEPGQLGTSLTISQWISLVVIAAALVFWGFLKKNGGKLALPPASAKIEG